ncbi:MAG: hypothetical protein HY784_17960 [Chloroflexi bacterium]|nr:hypothetical protein [Chloroflexota bacterium]
MSSRIIRAALVLGLLSLAGACLAAGPGDTSTAAAPSIQPPPAPSASTRDPAGRPSPSRTPRPGPTATPEPTVVFPPTSPPITELLRLSGTGPLTGEPFTLSVETGLRVIWNQSSTGEFVLTLENQDPAEADGPYGSVTYELAVGPSAGSADYTYIPGKYVVKVEKADGPWEVRVEVVPPEG